MPSASAGSRRACESPVRHAATAEQDQQLGLHALQLIELISGSPRVDNDLSISRKQGC
ncbi:MAG: hypothetical protein U0353_27415 [Sandaracinus sp.]